MSGTSIVSVVIPTYKHRDNVELALKSLMNQTLPASQYEVIVCIDGSEDGTREMASAFNAPYSLLVHWQPNKGRAAACNAGIRLAKGHIIVLLDDDMQASPDLLLGHVRAHQSGQCLGIVGAAPIQLGTPASATQKYIARKFNQHLQNLSQPGHTFTLRDFYSGNFSINRSVLLEIGMFDETFIIYGNEDVELSLRLRRAGVQLVYSPVALAWQSYDKNYRRLANDTLAKGKTTVQMVRKHPEIFKHTRLAGYAQVSKKWRVARACLLEASRLWPGMPGLLITIIALLEGYQTPGLHHIYGLTMDYCFWLGVNEALREVKLDLNALQKQVMT